MWGKNSIIVMETDCRNNSIIGLKDQYETEAHGSNRSSKGFYDIRIIIHSAMHSLKEYSGFKAP